MQYNACTIFMILVVLPWQIRLRNAAKAKLNRWVKPKTRRMDRNAPEILRTEWAKGSRNAIADLLCKNNFQEDCFLGMLMDVANLFDTTSTNSYLLKTIL